MNPVNANPTKQWNTLRQFVGNFPTNFLSVFEHFFRLGLIGLMKQLNVNFPFKDRDFPQNSSFISHSDCSVQIGNFLWDLQQNFV